MIFSTGLVYEGEFVNDIICGEGEMRFSSNSKYQGSWLNGMVSHQQCMFVLGLGCSAKHIFVTLAPLSYQYLLSSYVHDPYH